MSSKRNKADSLERFALRIESMLREGKSPSTVENLICRALTNAKQPQIAARMAEKWVEWRYGKAKEHVEHTGVDGAAIEHTIRFGDGNSDKEK